MRARRLVWKYSPLSRDKKEHENFAREILDTLFDVMKKSYNVKVRCTGYDIDDEGHSMSISTLNMKRTKFQMQFIYIDCIEMYSYDILMNRVGRYLNNNGYEFNPITNAIMFALHEIGHLVHSETMIRNSVDEIADYLYDYHNSLISMTVGDRESELVRNGDDVRYILSGVEMFCDGFAMTYFRAVANALVEKGLPKELLYTEFSLEDCVHVDSIDTATKTN